MVFLVFSFFGASLRNMARTCFFNKTSSRCEDPYPFLWTSFTSYPNVAFAKRTFANDTPMVFPSAKCVLSVDSKFAFFAKDLLHCGDLKLFCCYASNETLYSLRSWRGGIITGDIDSIFATVIFCIQTTVLKTCSAEMAWFVLKSSFFFQKLPFGQEDKTGPFSSNFSIRRLRHLRRAALPSLLASSRGPSPSEKRPLLIPSPKWPLVGTGTLCSRR